MVTHHACAGSGGQAAGIALSGENFQPSDRSWFALLEKTVDRGLSAPALLLILSLTSAAIAQGPAEFILLAPTGTRSQTATCRQVATSGPSPRDWYGMTHDATRNVTVLFGGTRELARLVHNNTWESNGTTWSDVTGSGAPGRRMGHQLVYDDERDVVVMFGGQDGWGGADLGDTWERTGVVWKEIMSLSLLSPRRHYGLACCRPSARAGQPSD